MSLWTPGGEHPVDRPGADRGVPAEAGPDVEPFGAEDLSDEERAQLEAMQQQMEQVQAQLLAAPAARVVANHAMGLYELAVLHLSAEPPNLAAARLPIDAMGILVDQLGDRLAEHTTLASALQQLRLTFVELSRHASEASDQPTD